jgi:hypothetical protein
VFVAAFFTVFIARKWKEKPLLLRQGFLLILIPLAGLAMFWGFFDSFRVYYEALPFALLLALPTVLEVFNIEQEKKFSCPN